MGRDDTFQELRIGAIRSLCQTTGQAVITNPGVEAYARDLQTADEFFTGDGGWQTICNRAERQALLNMEFQWRLMHSMENAMGKAAFQFFRWGRS